MNPSALLEAYKLDEIPPWFLPFFWIYSFVFAIALYCFWVLIRLTSRIDFSEDLKNSFSKKPIIYCFRHGDFGFYFPAFSFVGDVCISHPYWYMKPIHIALRWTRIKKIILGSTGAGGQEAADRLVEGLRAGHSTFYTPEGPHGPLGKPKKGILHIAEKSCAPIYFIEMDGTRYFRLRGWDRKKIPLPFGIIRARVKEKIFVTDKNFEEALALLEKAFGN